MEEVVTDLSLKKKKPNIETENNAVQDVKDGVDLSLKNAVETNYNLTKILDSPSIGICNLQNVESRKRKRIELQQHRNKYPLHSFHHQFYRPSTFIESANVNSPDVIVLTDEEDTLINGHVNGIESNSRADTPESDMTLPVSPQLKELTEEEWREREKKITTLKHVLRDEEMKLVLLKKLHQSQIMKENIIGTAVNTAKSNIGRVSGDTSFISSPLIRSHLSSSANNKYLLQRSVMQPSTVPTSISPVPHSIQTDRADNQTPAQRQAAAKLALRKQLEKTLLQIPPPKPPPPELHFVPNANSPDFIYLLGLEVVVSFFTGDNIYNKLPPDPFECVQCSTNFTPVWKWQETSTLNKKPSVICEKCVTSNIKKALKAEHTNRLKTAFVKALQQEQEIEQRMSQGFSCSPPPSLAPTSPLHISNTVTPIVAPTSPQNHVSNPISKIATTATAVIQQQSLLQAQQMQLNQNQPQPAHMLSFAPLLAAQAYSYQMMGKSSISSSELQRQYLLDMIPPRSLTQSAMNWKA